MPTRSTLEYETVTTARADSAPGSVGPASYEIRSRMLLKISDSTAPSSQHPRDPSVVHALIALGLLKHRV